MTQRYFSIASILYVPQTKHIKGKWVRRRRRRRGEVWLLKQTHSCCFGSFIKFNQEMHSQKCQSWERRSPGILEKNDEPHRQK